MNRCVSAAVAVLLWSWCVAVSSASAGAASAADAPARPAYNVARWKESYAFLADRSKQSDYFDPLKYLPIGTGNKAYLTVAGQWREEAISFDAPLFGLKDPRADRYLLHRMLLAADLHLGDCFRFFAELGNELAPGKRRPLSVTDQDRLNLQLAFADYTQPWAGGVLTARVGRQEIFFDPTERFLAVREGPNIRQAFDGARVDWVRGKLSVSVFATSPVNYSDRALLDDSANYGLHFDGVYVQWKLPDGVPGMLSPYFYRYTRTGAVFDTTRGNELRNAWAIRYSGQSGGFGWDIEGMRQTGHVGTAKVRAWAAGSIVQYSFQNARWQPDVVLQADVASGDRHPDDGEIQTFNPLFPKGAYFTEAGLTGLANLRHIKLTLGFRPWKSTLVSFAYGEVWKQTRNDYAYAQPLIPIPHSLAMSDLKVGSYAEMVVSHAFNRHLSLALEIVTYSASQALRAAGGYSINYSKLNANYFF